MTPTVIALISITGWALGALVAWLGFGWCRRFVARTTHDRNTGWKTATVIVSPFIVVFWVLIAVCLLMTVRYGWHLVVITWPHMGDMLPPF